MIALDTVRSELLAEAKSSPLLFEDLAGLEQYIAESYNSRSFTELLQNADDAGASRFRIERAGEHLLVANDGRRFSDHDLRALCRSAASAKRRGECIGYRGIGFKSVVGLAEVVHLISGDLATTFSRNRTKEDVPGVARVPLVRIPHRLTEVERQPFAQSVANLQENGYETIFVFSGLLAGSIEAEYEQFDDSSLLFLRNVRQVELKSGVEALISVRRVKRLPNRFEIVISSPHGRREWMIFSSGDVSLAFSAQDGTVVPLPESEAVAHAFLPTHDPTGLGLKTHGDISTDPSRTRVVLDDRTRSTVESLADMLVCLLADGLRGDSESRALLSAVTPLTDPRAGVFQRKSFKTTLLEAIRDRAAGKLSDYYLRPKWLNAKDFEVLASNANMLAVPHAVETIEGMRQFLVYLQLKEANFELLGSQSRSVELTKQGATEVVAQMAQREINGQGTVDASMKQWRVWQVNEELRSLDELEAQPQLIDPAFIDQVVERTPIPSALTKLVEKLSPQAAVKVLPSSPKVTVQLDVSAASDPGVGPKLTAENTGRVPNPAHETGHVERISLRRWRGAEQQVAQLWTAQGWAVEDVSRSNLGYDLECISPEGTKVFMEVKLVERLGQPIIMTSNEEAVARQRGTEYWVVIVSQLSNCLQVVVVRDPVRSMEMRRQCRQWVWECTGYEADPQTFPLI